MRTIKIPTRLPVLSLVLGHHFHAHTGEFMDMEQAQIVRDEELLKFEQMRVSLRGQREQVVFVCTLSHLCGHDMCFSVR